MIEAGASAIFEYRNDVTAWDLAAEVYSAMERERTGTMTCPDREAVPLKLWVK
jgi:hypothetical protein